MPRGERVEFSKPKPVAVSCMEGGSDLVAVDAETSERWDLDRTDREGHRVQNEAGRLDQGTMPLTQGQIDHLRRSLSG